MAVRNILSGQQQMHFIGVGVVVEDKVKNVDEVKVVIPTIMSSVDGKVSELDKRRVSGRAPDVMGNTKGSEHTKKVTIRAMWHKEDSGNRNNAPDVRKHESVMIYRYADTDQYFWMDKGREPKFRGLEHAVFTWGNEKARDKEYDIDTSYNMTVSTDEKKIQLKTANNDGEHTTYDIKLDTKAGHLHIKDGKGNWLKLDSRADSLLGNINKNVTLTVGSDISVTAGGNITLKAGADITLQAGGNVNIKSAGLNHNGTNVGDTHVHTKVKPGPANTGKPA